MVGHLSICRFDHWFKNVFVLPGILMAVALEPSALSWEIVPRALLGLLAIGFVASSNYVVNELRDAEFDRHHPTKRHRPVPSGRVNQPLAYVQWLFLGGLGIGLGLLVSFPFAMVMLALWVMGCVYNLKPVRSKDLPYVDVISEAVNNPLRLLAGWFIVGPEAIAPASLLLSYWMVGCYFMAIKRFAEYRHIGDPERAASYRRSFAYYTDDRLLISIMFYASAAMLLFGVFIARYRLSLVLSVPFVALVMALYLQLGLREDSPVQNPEALYRQGTLMMAVAICAVVMTVCLFVDFPWIYDLFAPTAPVNPLS